MRVRAKGIGGTSPWSGRRAAYVRRRSLRRPRLRAMCEPPHAGKEGIGVAVVDVAGGRAAARVSTVSCARRGAPTASAATASTSCSTLCDGDDLPATLRPLPEIRPRIAMDHTLRPTPIVRDSPTRVKELASTSRIIDYELSAAASPRAAEPSPA